MAIQVVLKIVSDTFFISWWYTFKKSVYFTFMRLFLCFKISASSKFEGLIWMRHIWNFNLDPKTMSGRKKKKKSTRLNLPSHFPPPPKKKTKNFSLDINWICIKHLFRTFLRNFFSAANSKWFTQQPHGFTTYKLLSNDKRLIFLVQLWCLSDIKNIGTRNFNSK